MTVLPRHFERWQSNSKREDLILKFFPSFFGSDFLLQFGLRDRIATRAARADLTQWPLGYSRRRATDLAIKNGLVYPNFCNILFNLPCDFLPLFFQKLIYVKK